MNPYYADDWLTVYHGDARTVLATMEPESVHCVVTSPPYWGLRDYGEPGQLGLEATPEAYVAALVDVFREVRRVLRSDGTVWLNLGDSYAGSGKGAWDRTDVQKEVYVPKPGGPEASIPKVPDGLKPKDLVGIPWMVAFALRADGWYLRSDIIWSKPNPMPESVTDRPTKSHEYLFLLSKSARYYYDADAVRETSTGEDSGNGFARPERLSGGLAGGNTERWRAPSDARRNIRSVWTVATQPYPGAHFATFPPKLIEPCIKAGTSEKGVCPECGAPWEREVVRDQVRVREGSDTSGSRAIDIAQGRTEPSLGSIFTTGTKTVATTIGWRPGCRCEHDGGGWVSVGATVLDPFAGSGTTGMVAQSLSRRAVLIDLSMDYLGQLMDRNRDIPLGLGA